MWNNDCCGACVIFAFFSFFFLFLRALNHTLLARLRDFSLVFDVADVHAPNCFAQESINHDNLQMATAGDSALLGGLPHSFEIVTMDQFFNYVQAGAGLIPVVEFGNSGFTGEWMCLGRSLFSPVGGTVVGLITVMYRSEFSFI